MKKRKTATGNALRDILNHSNITETRAFALAKVNRTTWQRWLAGTSNPPAATVELIRRESEGRINDPAWVDFRLVNGVLVDKHGYEYKPDDIYGLRNAYQDQHRYFELQRYLETVSIQPKLF